MANEEKNVLILSKIGLGKNDHQTTEKEIQNSTKKRQAQNIHLKTIIMLRSISARIARFPA